MGTSAEKTELESVYKKKTKKQKKQKGKSYLKHNISWKERHCQAYMSGILLYIILCSLVWSHVTNAHHNIKIFAQVSKRNYDVELLFITSSTQSWENWMGEWSIDIKPFGIKKKYKIKIKKSIHL